MAYIEAESSKSKNHLNHEKEENLIFNNFRVLKALRIGKIHGEIVGKLASSRYYVHRKDSISDLAYDFDHDKAILAVGVVNDDNELEGIIVRKELFDILFIWAYK